MPHLTPMQTARAIAKPEEGFFTKAYFHFNNVLITSQSHLKKKKIKKKKKKKNNFLLLN
jgi:hypothetical protein